MQAARLLLPILAALAVAAPMLRKVILTAAALAAMSQLAAAGDRLGKSAPYAVSWTGFYVGANAGYGWARASTTITSTSGAASLSNSGDLNAFIGGGQIGYNWQASNVVLGLEADFQASPQKQTSTVSCGVGCTLTETSGVDWFGTARGRIGYAFDRFMVYGTGGAAWTRVSNNLVGNAGGGSANNLSLSGSEVGWTLGGGAEWMMLDRWSAKLEYLYIRTSNLTGTGNLPPFLGGAAVTAAVTFNNSIVRVGLNYHF
jgi:outer membrane immunogenic protein